MKPKQAFRIMATIFITGVVTLMFATHGPGYWPAWVGEIGLVVAWALIYGENNARD
jgi:hypothetical protein